MTFGKRFFFQPERWDSAPALPGMAYAPDVHVHAGEHLKPVPVPVSVVSADARFVSAFARGRSRGRAARGLPPRFGGGAAVVSLG